MRKKKECPRYLEQAQAAAQLEQQGHFTNAAFVWAGAAQFAATSINENWALARSEYCDKWAKRYDTGAKAA
ncbi:ANR family transcriptional regulator [Vibrio mediterranei]|uniref:ANR family transcriptional regulator n=1 Tax=Vibrio mediterranei TaxID=689 RepID=UPI001EFE67E5|nr:ANR family transcriptional regulator [Vibrio mediterranei]MCG9624613.1 ANR family transcriptional regulator [Vibrio mediterranei]